LQLRVGIEIILGEICLTTVYLSLCRLGGRKGESLLPEKLKMPIHYMKEYITREAKHTAALTAISKKYNFISYFRILASIAVIVLLYQSFSIGGWLIIGGFVLAFTAFIILMKLHQRLSWQQQLGKTLIEINRDEIRYLERKGIPFDAGTEFISDTHAYTFDLDVFGSDSLFHHLNRTATYIGRKKLSLLLGSLLTPEAIIRNQDAIKELSLKIDWRQDLLALAKIAKDNHLVYEQLVAWPAKESKGLTPFLTGLSYLTPVLFFTALIGFIITGNSNLGYTAFYLSLFNMFLLFTQLKKIKSESIHADKVDEIMQRYSLLFQKIEQASFQSEKLQMLQKQLTHQSGAVSAQIKKLSSLLSAMDSLQNGLGVFLFNGSFLYHLHILRSLTKWKKDFAVHIPEWLEVMGEFEALNSLANFSFNNPAFVFPALNTDHNISLEALGHPLIPEEKRVCNSIDFNNNRFIILTGSNMSGKSTFLRTLGINMVLAGIGAPVCTRKADIHPLPVVVSMRLSDSLADSESYFFAEVKRLKEIMNHLDKGVCFVLLDEILRGTNSDDKRSGTIAIVKKMVEKNAIGAIATHDIEVCNTTVEYPHQLVNKCFEVAIINNELVFDYTLREGVCKNKSATFLMKKMEII
jgi:energy-coupling factor transporter ATP-binding protein EcfA2